jgi:hypothetical protein
MDHPDSESTEKSHDADSEPSQAFRHDLPRHGHGCACKLRRRLLSRRTDLGPQVPDNWKAGGTMTYAILTIERAVNGLEVKTRKASNGARRALAFGIVAAAYGLIVVGGLHGAHASALI